MNYKMIGKVDEALLNLQKLKVRLFEEDESSYDDIWVEAQYEIKKLTKSFRHITGNKIIRNISDEVRQQRADNMRKNRLVRTPKCTTQQQEQ